MIHRRLLLPTIAALTGLLFAALALLAPPPRLTAQAAPDDSFTLTILHTNDIHAHYAPYNNDGSACTNEANCLGGTARLKTLVDQIRGAEPNSILVDAGDEFQGTLYYKLFKSEIVAASMNALGYDAMAIGNHEFDDGPHMLAGLVDAASFPVLGANVDVHAEPELAGKIPATTIITLAGEKIGLFGLTTPEAAFLAKPGPNVTFGDPVQSAQAAVAALEGQGVVKIIALTHLGYSEDLALAGAVDGIDVIVGGHSHSFVYSPAGPITFSPPQFPKYGELNPVGASPTVVYAPDGSPVLVTTAACWNAFLGKLQVTFDELGKVSAYNGNPIYLSNSIAKDSAITTMMAPYDEKVAELRATVIGSTTLDMPVWDGDTGICRIGECLLGDLVADAMLWKINAAAAQMPSSGDGSGGYQIALINAGGLRAPLSGDISVGDILEVLPYGNSIATFEITGAHLTSALESGVSRFGSGSGSGRFPQVAGLRYKVDPGSPLGSRIISATVQTAAGWTPIDPEGLYRVVTLDYVRTGGDGYTDFRDYAINPYDYGVALDEAVQDYVKALKTITSNNLFTGRVFVNYRLFFPFSLLLSALP